MVLIWVDIQISVMIGVICQELLRVMPLVILIHLVVLIMVIVVMAQLIILVKFVMVLIWEGTQLIVQHMDMISELLRVMVLVI